jgi:hypothetical protein
VGASEGNLVEVPHHDIAGRPGSQHPLLPRGEGLWRVNERAFVVRHICTPDELTLFDTDARMLSGRPVAALGLSRPP